MIADSTPGRLRERAMAMLLAKVLGYDGFGVDGNFFDIGGDSVAASGLLLEIETAFHVHLQPDILLDHAIIAGLAGLVARSRNPSPSAASEKLEALLRRLTDDGGGEPAAAGGLIRGLNRGGSGRPWFWCVQEGKELHQLAGILGADHPLYAMRSGHLLMSYTPEMTAWLAGRYLREIVAADPSGPYFFGGVCQGSIVVLEIARQLQGSGRRVALLALIDTSFCDVFKSQPYPGRPVDGWRRAEADLRPRP